jgi:hypothetical protein
MAGKEQLTVTVRMTAWELTEGLDSPVYLDAGHVLPRRWRASAVMPDGTELELVVAVEDRDGRPRARAAELVIRSEDPGVSWELMSTIPVRNLVATACLAAMWKTRIEAGKTELVRVVPVKDPAELYEILRRLVGYRVEDRLVGVEAK